MMIHKYIPLLLISMLLSHGQARANNAPPAAQAPSAAPMPTAVQVQQGVLAGLLDAAMERAKVGQWRPATKILNHCIKLDKTFPGCHRMLGMLYDKQGATRKAVQEYRLYLKLSHLPDDSDAIHEVMLPFSGGMLDNNSSPEGD